MNNFHKLMFVICDYLGIKNAIFRLFTDHSILLLCRLVKKDNINVTFLVGFIENVQ